MKTLLALASAVVLPLLISCGGSEPPPATPPSSSATPPSTAAPTGTTATATPPAAGAWKDMNHDQRLDFMKNTVLPKMKEEFSGFDPKFAGMNCGTCHGDGMKDGSFKMPNPKLPKLNPEGGFKKHMTDKPEITKFMMSKVAPDMAALLGMPHYDPKTGQGFGCGGCHLMDK